ncbi:MAG TPA: ubiquinol-cytochrome c reductase iron-sulfur subunit [Chitinophagaceae bacterium]|nr:ubiquinol-cytochrome c reductase iron-sulfur subunit [Chitinophagaceae bacterium]
MQRRGFINNIAQITTFVTAGSLIAACSKSSGNPSTGNGNGGGSTLISANLDGELINVGDSKTSGTNIVIREATGNAASSFIALSLVCTHQGCTVNFDNANNVFNCPCHGSKYDGSGNVVNGPATKALSKLSITVTGSELVVS